MPDSGDVTVRLLEPDEAGLLVELIRRCYRDTYIDPTFYDVDAVRERLASGRLSSVGAFVGDDALAGHMGITTRPWGGNTADAGMTLVDPAQRGHGIARQVAVGLAQQAVALGLVGVHDYPVTVHAATQRLAKGYGADTGLMLANMPADVSFERMETPAPGQRTSSLIRWLPFGRPPEREVHLPDRYADILKTLYDEANLLRTPRVRDAALLGGGSEIHTVVDLRRNIARLVVMVAGEDLVARVASETEFARQRGVLVAHVDLSLSDRTTPAATEALRTLRYSFAGLLPEYRNGDVLRLQWLSVDAESSAVTVLSSDTTRAIQAFVLADRAGL
ncbi:MAG: GNAT family N-acetyltransferase [Polyangiales bacterium]